MFPPAPPECKDRELWDMLHEFEFCRWHPDHTDRADEIRSQLRQPRMIQRLKNAVTDPTPALRMYAGQLVVALRSPESVGAAIELLADPDESVRGRIAGLVFGFPHEKLQQPLTKLAKEDPSPFVRGQAARGLAGQDPLVSIPILLEIIENDHQVDLNGNTPPPSEVAADALDEKMGTEWMAKRSPEGVCTFPPGPRDMEAVKQQALVFYHHCLARNKNN